MLSILIPTYNYNVYPLAFQLEQQALDANIVFEIICFDDGSSSKLNFENDKINTLKNSKFIALEKNIGLSNNRNELAQSAKYDYLLFIDGDSVIIDKNYIRQYINSINENTEVVYGGRIHPKTVTSNRKLRWKYGIYREDLNSQQRIKNKYKSVLFNNTLIKKSVFDQIRFEKQITKYGHEDTIFAFNLSKIKATIKHIDNPVLHGDVDLNMVFFNKTHKSIENLNLIYNKNLIDSDFVTFLKVFKKLKKARLNYLFGVVHKILYPIFKYNLTSKYPSLYIFELFRLSYFCNINLKK
ncbi:glycosyltransferase family 2 protein [Thalassobellus suaedae]|uniref:Glycosyltransferase n=1 Tax=Thalassobellus suaedae TaxID=3074124 RepID=A0ABY9XP93_9FLAO|nr:glycosyltransferase [Flavobacteriaceae bacterium HL-DH14]